MFARAERQDRLDPVRDPISPPQLRKKRGPPYSPFSHFLPHLFPPFFYSKNMPNFKVYVAALAPPFPRRSQPNSDRIDLTRSLALLKQCRCLPRRLGTQGDGELRRQERPALAVTDWTCSYSSPPPPSPLPTLRRFLLLLRSSPRTRCAYLSATYGASDCLRGPFTQARTHVPPREGSPSLFDDPAGLPNSRRLLSFVQYGPAQPLKGARIAGCLHMTIQVSPPRNLPSSQANPPSLFRPPSSSRPSPLWELPLPGRYVQLCRSKEHEVFWRGEDGALADPASSFAVLQHLLHPGPGRRRDRRYRCPRLRVEGRD